MQELKKGSQGAEVERWQTFLHGKGYSSVYVDGIFGKTTELATIAFQDLNGLRADGIAGQSTFAKAMLQGLPVVKSSSMPPLPNFPSPSSAARERMLGKFRYQTLDGGQIKILDNWAAQNITKIQIPQLIGIEGAPSDGRIFFHKNGARQLLSLFAAWEAEGLTHLIKTWAGSFVPRLIRGSATQLSNHAYGSAFDINAAWNGLGRQPATGEGTVLPLVKLANQHGFFWGGHYGGRKDGMHFELAVLNMFPKTIPNVREDEINLYIPEKSSPAIGQSGNPAVNPAENFHKTADNSSINPLESISDDAQSPEDSRQIAENITNVNNGDRTIPDNFVPENKIVNAPPPSGMLKKGAVWAAGLGLGLPSLSGTIETVKNYAADGTFNIKDAFGVAATVGKFILPYAVYIGLAFVIFWGIKELLKQVSLIVKIWVTGRADMHNVEVEPFAGSRK